MRGDFIGPVNRREIAFALWLAFFFLATQATSVENTYLLFGLLLVGPLLPIAFNPSLSSRSGSSPQINLCALLLTGAIALSYIANWSAYEKVFILGNLASTVLLFLTIRAVVKYMDLRLQKVLVAYSVVVNLLLPWSLLQGEMAWGRLIPHNLHPNFLGMVALTALVGALAAPSLLRILILGVLPIFTILAVSSRASLVSAVVALLCWSITSSRYRRATLRTSGFVLLLFAVAVSLLAAFSGDNMAERIAAILSSVLLIDDQHRGVASGGSGRLELWRAAYQVWESHPIFGVGLKGHTSHMPDWALSHSAYLGMLADVGMFGFLSYCALLAVGLGALYGLRKSADFPLRLALVATYLLYGLVETRAFSFGNPYSILFMFVLFDCTRRHGENLRLANTLQKVDP